MSKRHLNKYSSNKASCQTDQGNRNINRQDIDRIIVEVYFLTEYNNHNEIVMNEISPERYFSNEVEKFGIHEEEDEIIFYP